MEEKKQQIFRKETLERISSPEQLTDYLHVTTPGIWIVLVAVITLLIGIFVWAAVGTLETTVDVAVVVEDHTARVVPEGSAPVSKGMIVRASSEEASITSTEADTYGRTVGLAYMALPDGVYEGEVVVDRTRPLDFLTESR